VDSGTGEPIPGARMIIKHLKDSVDHRQIKITVGEDGVFNLKDVPAGIHRLTFLHNDYLPFCEKEFQVLDGIDRKGVRFSLTPGSLTINGLLKTLKHLSQRKGPPQNCHELKVSFESDALISADYDLGVDVADAGRFQLKGLPTGEVVIVIYHRRRIIHKEKTTLPLPQGGTLEIEIPMHNLTERPF